LTPRDSNSFSHQPCLSGCSAIVIGMDDGFYNVTRGEK
jgi:hypothetical protein